VPTAALAAIVHLIALLLVVEAQELPQIKHKAAVQVEAVVAVEMPVLLAQMVALEPLDKDSQVVAAILL
jgi:hypothetical protein